MSDMQDSLRELYQEVIFDHNRKPRNYHPLPAASHHADGHNPLCGDQLTVYVQVEDGIVREASFVGHGCAISTASASLMTEAVKGKPVAEVEALFSDVHALLAPLHHRETALRVTAERALNKHLNGGCQVPIACYALLENDQLWLRGLVGQPDGGLLLRAEDRAASSDAEALGVRVAEALLAQGADAILQAVYGEAGHP